MPMQVVTGKSEDFGEDAGYGSVLPIDNGGQEQAATDAAPPPADYGSSILDMPTSNNDQTMSQAPTVPDGEGSNPADYHPSNATGPNGQPQPTAPGGNTASPAEPAQTATAPVGTDESNPAPEDNAGATTAAGHGWRPQRQRTRGADDAEPQPERYQPGDGRHLGGTTGQPDRDPTAGSRGPLGFLAGTVLTGSKLTRAVLSRIFRAAFPEGTRPCALRSSRRRARSDPRWPC